MPHLLNLGGNASLVSHLYCLGITAFFNRLRMDLVHCTQIPVLVIQVLGELVRSDRVQWWVEQRMILIPFPRMDGGGGGGSAQEVVDKREFTRPVQRMHVGCTVAWTEIRAELARFNC